MGLTRASEVTIERSDSEGASLDLNELCREGAAVLITVKEWGEEKDWGNGVMRPVHARVIALTGAHAGEIDDDALLFKKGVINKLNEIGQHVVGRLRPYGQRKNVGLEAEEDGDVERAMKVLKQLGELDEDPEPKSSTPVTDEVNAAKKKAADRKAAAKKVALDDESDDEPPF